MCVAHDLQASAFIHWKDWAKFKARNRDIMSAALVRLRHNSIARAWACWRDIVRISKKAMVAATIMHQWCSSALTPCTEVPCKNRPELNSHDS